MLERHQHAEIAGRGIDRADEGDQRDQGELLDIAESEAGGRHQRRAEQQQRAQVVTGGDEADARVSSAVPSSDAVATKPIATGS